MRQARVEKVCETCGTDRVVVDAHAEWDVDAQRWELAHTYEYSFCKDCDGETTIVERPL